MFTKFVSPCKGILLTGLSFLLLSCAYTSQPPSSLGAYDPQFSLAIERGRNIVSPLIRRGAGVSVAVGVDGKLVWSEGFGFTSLDGNEQIKPYYQFRIYSLMKQITAVMALQSVLQGELSFSTPATDVIPGLPERFADVTLLHLITHTSGVRHYHHPEEAVFFNHCVSAQDGLPLFVNDQLLHTPGETESYSTYGFVLASAMLENATNSTFDSLVEERISEPAGIGTLQLETRHSKASTMSFYDVDEDGRTSEALPVDNSCKMGGGGFVASAEDVVRFHNAVLNGNLVPEPAIRQLLGSRNSLEAGGGGVGAQAVSIVDLDSRVSVVILSNTSGLEQQIALNRARGLLLDIFSEG